MLIDEKVCLEPLSERHVGAHYLSWVNNPATMAFTSSGDRSWSVKDLKEYLSRMGTEGQTPFAIIDRATGRHVGNVKLGIPGSIRPGWIDIGIVIGELSARNKGIATRAYRLALDYAFRSLHVDGVFSGVFLENEASLRLHRAVGFEEYPHDVPGAVRFVMSKERYLEIIGTALPCIALIQARMSSRRLPGKVLADIAGKPCLQWVIERVKKCGYLDETIVVTSLNHSDDPIETLCDDLGVQSFRGSESNVLDRMLSAVKDVPDHALIVRVTADCPCYCPELLDWAFATFHEQSDYLVDFDHVLPDGLDIELMRLGAFRSSQSFADRPSDLEHATQALRRHSDVYVLQNYHPPIPASGDVRITLDAVDDLNVLRNLFAACIGAAGEGFGAQDILGYVKSHPETLEANSSHVRDEGLLLSIEEDGV